MSNHIAIQMQDYGTSDFSSLLIAIKVKVYCGNLAGS